MAYIMERNSTVLVAASSQNLTYFDYDSYAYLTANTSTDAKVRWSAQVLADPKKRAVGESRNRDAKFPDGVTMHHFDTADGDGELYYVARSPINFDIIGDMGLSWDLVQVQSVVCSSGYVSIEGVCTQCPSGTSANVYSQTCDVCGAGEFSQRGSSQCSTCDAGKSSQYNNGSAVCLSCPGKTNSVNGSDECAYW